MRAFVQIGRNLSMAHANPSDASIVDEKGEISFMPVAEIVITTVEPDYKMIQQKSAIEGGNPKMTLVKVPEITSFRFIANISAVELMLESLSAAHAELTALGGGERKCEEKSSAVTAE